MALTIAASDPLGGAGVQADLVTFAAFGVHGTSAVTSVTAQSLRNVAAVAPVNLEVVAAQIDSVIADFSVAAVKTGLLSRREVVELVASRVTSRTPAALVIDPVMVDGRGERFVAVEVEHAYRQLLFPLATVITPNRAEAEFLVGESLPDAAAVLDHADNLRELGAEAVVVTGGAFAGAPDDVVITAADGWVEPGERVQTANVRGSGCTFSAALASGLAKGHDITQAVVEARRFVHTAIRASANWHLNGRGPISHILT